MNRLPALLPAALFLLCLVSPASAIQPTGDDHVDVISRLNWSRPADLPVLEVAPSLDDGSSSSILENTQRPAIAAFTQRAGGAWEVRWDRRSDRPNLIQGSGIALLPGRGNTLRLDQVGLRAGQAVDLDVVQRLAREFIDDNADVLGSDGLDLRLDEERSVGYGEGNSHWFIEFGQYHDGIRVDGAFVFVRVAQGNVVQFGSEKIDSFELDTKPSLPREQAFALAYRELGFPAGTRIVETVEAGELKILPTAPAGEAEAEAYRGTPGAGYGHQLVWRFVFRIAGEPTTIELLVDARSNRVLQVQDLNLYAEATVSGGIYPTTNTEPEITVAFPFTSVTNSGTKVTSTFGVYDYAGGTATTTLNGKYFRMTDTCGSISLANSTNGNLNLGTSGGTNCTTPGIGGSGNTHASRTGFYHLTRINEKARGILTTNSWLQTTVTANMNVQDVCNAYWSSPTLNFFRSGASGTTNCANTGEIAAVFLHEWGHGVDQNTGGAASNDQGSGEAVGDTFAFLETRSSCIGPGFYTNPGATCYNCNTCSGVRDLKDFSASGTRVAATPANVTADNGINCDRFLTTTGAVNCPYKTNQGTGSLYRGVMGYEGHCEALISGSANWNLAQSLVSRYGDSGWSQMDRIWYGSLTPSKSAYQVASGGTCNPSAVVNGCAATNWYTVYLAADDDDGNLANGTPNACRIWDSFNAQGIACSTRPACTADVPAFSLTAGNASQSSCGPAVSASYTIGIGSEFGFATPVTLQVSGLPGDAGAVFSPNPAAPGSNVTLTISGSNVAAGSYPLTVTGSANGAANRSASLQWDVTAAPAAPVSEAPADGNEAVAVPSIALQWSSVAGASTYSVELARDEAFSDLVGSAGGIAATTWDASGLDPATRYYWRVRAANTCGDGGASDVATFGTSYTVGGNVSGLLGTGLVLRLNGTEILPVAAGGGFRFDMALPRDAAFAVSVASQPASPIQECVVSQGDGTASGSNIDTVTVTCGEGLFANGFDDPGPIP